MNHLRTRAAAAINSATEFFLEVTEEWFEIARLVGESEQVETFRSEWVTKAQSSQNLETELEACCEELCLEFDVNSKSDLQLITQVKMMMILLSALRSTASVSDLYSAANMRRVKDILPNNIDEIDYIFPALEQSAEIKDLVTRLASLDMPNQSGLVADLSQKD